MEERRFHDNDRRKVYDLSYFIAGGTERRKLLYKGRRMGESLVRTYKPPPKLQSGHK